MEVAPQYVYLVALIPFCLIWISIFLARKDLRQEMLVMSIIVGLLGLATSYYWWTVDWWRPLNITGTRIGVEDFIIAFTSGGIMATLYEVVFKRGLYKRRLHHHASAGLTILLLLSQTTMWLFWGVGLTSFWASTFAMLVTALVVVFVRKDLIATSLLSGILMVLVSFSFYLVILLLSKEWIAYTYLDGISGIRFIGIPIEELVFWFMSGLVFGPLYEYWQGERLKVMR
ncbi:MAG TPA: lycopene cyclase domain-containing protein [Candidatus Paceibacterota bacterium]